MPPVGGAAVRRAAAQARSRSREQRFLAGPGRRNQLLALSASLDKHDSTLITVAQTRHMARFRIRGVARFTISVPAARSNWQVALSLFRPLGRPAWLPSASCGGNSLVKGGSGHDSLRERRGSQQAQSTTLTCRNELTVSRAIKSYQELSRVSRGAAAD
jgi:hypothetical protein